MILHSKLSSDAQNWVEDKRNVSPDDYEVVSSTNGGDVITGAVLVRSSLIIGHRYIHFRHR
jgi:hypothetical protein